jgi:hypothetical protein
MSPRFTLNKEDMISIAKGAAIAALGAGAVYSVEGIAKLDFQIWSPAITALAAILVNIIRKWLEDNQPKKK